MYEILIREALPEDVEAIVSLTDHLGYALSAEETRERIALFSELPHQMVWVAVSREKVIGCISTCLCHFLHKVGSFVRILSLAVDPHFSGQGIGKALLEKVEAYAREARAGYVEVSSAMHRKALGTHEFYLKCGYEDLLEKHGFFAKQIPAVKPGC